MEQKTPDRNKYDHSGVYSISAFGHILYIGKSKNMRQRVMTHIRHIRKPEGSEDNRGINKYYVFNEIYEHGITISFDVLYSGDDIDYMEAYYINKYKPILNMKIPQLNNPSYCLTNELAATITLNDILTGMWEFQIEDEMIDFESAEELAS